MKRAQSVLQEHPVYLDLILFLCENVMAKPKVQTVFNKNLTCDEDFVRECIRSLLVIFSWFQKSHLIKQKEKLIKIVRFIKNLCAFSQEPMKIEEIWLNESEEWEWLPLQQNCEEFRKLYFLKGEYAPDLKQSFI